MNFGHTIIDEIKKHGTTDRSGTHLEVANIGRLTLRDTPHSKGRDIVIAGTLANGDIFYSGVFDVRESVQFLANYTMNGEAQKADAGICINKGTGEPTPDNNDSFFPELWEQRDLVIGAVMQILNALPKK